MNQQQQRMIVGLVWLLLISSVRAGGSQPPDGPSRAPLPFLMPGDFEDLDLCAWRVEPGRLDPHNPLVEPAMPWDAGGVLAHGTVLRDPLDGLWKAWQISIPPARSPEQGRLRFLPRITYLESNDGGARR